MWVKLKNGKPFFLVSFREGDNRGKERNLCDQPEECVSGVTDRERRYENHTYQLRDWVQVCAAIQPDDTWVSSPALNQPPVDKLSDNLTSARACISKSHEINIATRTLWVSFQCIYRDLKIISLVQYIDEIEKEKVYKSGNRWIGKGLRSIKIENSNYRGFDNWQMNSMVN